MTNEFIPTAASNAYDYVCSLRTSVERMREGSNADLHMWEETGWLFKSDKQGATPQAAHEYRIYEALHKHGLAGVVTPSCRLEEGVLQYGGCDALVISCINNCATIFEYGEAYKLGKLSAELWHDLCGKVGRILKEFHKAGFVHVDLHSLNVAVELDQNGLRPYLIDFGYTSYDYIEYPYSIIDFDDLEPKSDVQKLSISLKDIDNSPDFLEGIRIFEEEADL